MYNILKNVISRGEFSLPEIEQKIDKLWAENKLSEVQRDELVTTARTTAKPENNVDLYASFKLLEARVTALEEGNKPTSDTPPEWKDGMVVYRGARITHDSKVYRCIAPEGQPCSWSPSQYAPYWEEE